MGVYMLFTAVFLTTDWISRQIRTKRIDLYFVASLIYTFTVTTGVFALEYYGLSRLEPASFSVDNPGFFNLLSLSFCTLMTSADLALVKPSSTMAIFISQLNLLCSFLIVGLFLTIVLTSIRERYAFDLNTLVSQLDLINEEVGAFLLKSYKLSLVKLEEFLIENEPNAVKLMLRLRYGRDWENIRPLAASRTATTEVIDVPLEEVNEENNGESEKTR